MFRAVLLIPYFGPFPKWFDLFLLTAARNPDYRFLIYTDQAPVAEAANIEWRASSLEQVRQRIAATIGVDMSPRASSYKLCDFKPCYGEIFAEDINEPFWGHADIDIVWGRLSHILTPPVFDHDIISGQASRICGPFTLYRNTPRINSLYRGVPGVDEILRDEKHVGFDEIMFSEFVKGQDIYHGRHGHSENRARHIYLQGKILRVGLRETIREFFKPGSRERMFFHFRTWKAGMIHDFDPKDVLGWQFGPDRLTPITR